MTPPHRFAAEVRCYRQTLLDAGRWVHVAWTWDVRGDVSVRGGGEVKERAKDGVLVQYLFIDGKRGRFSPDVVAGYKPAHEPLSLVSGAGFDGEMDELHISDVMRYTDDFTPPRRDQEMRADEHTRALFHFNGTLEGESGGSGKPVVRVE